MGSFKGTGGDWKPNRNNIQVNPEHPILTNTVCMVYGPKGEERKANLDIISESKKMLVLLMSINETSRARDELNGAQAEELDRILDKLVT